MILMLLIQKLQNNWRLCRDHNNDEELNEMKIFRFKLCFCFTAMALYFCFVGLEYSIDVHETLWQPVYRVKQRLLLNMHATNFSAKWHNINTFRHVDMLKRNVTVISVAVPDKIGIGNDDLWTYVFYLPFTTYSWNKLGFHVIILIVLDWTAIEPDAEEQLYFVLKCLEKMSSLSVVYVDVYTDLKVRISQVMRLYGAWIASLEDDVFMLVSDTDLWPINKHRLLLNPIAKILVTNSNCCGRFKHKGTWYQHLPMSHICMHMKLWKQIFPIKIERTRNPKDMDNFPFLKSIGNHTINYLNQKSVVGMLKELKETFDIAVLHKARIGDKYWSTDQKFASLKIFNYKALRNESTFIEFEKPQQCKRVDRSDWENGILSKTCKSDAHLLHGKVWETKEWNRLMLLMKVVFDSNAIKNFEIYKEHFMRLYSRKV